MFWMRGWMGVRGEGRVFFSYGRELTGCWVWRAGEMTVYTGQETDEGSQGRSNSASRQGFSDRDAEVDARIP